MQKLLGTFLLSMVVELMLVPLRGIYMPYVVRAMLTLLLIAAFTFFVLRSYKKSTDINLIYIALIVLLGIAVPEIIPRLNRWQEALGAFPDLISRLSGVVLGYILFIIPNIYLKISSAVVMALFVSFANIPANNIFYNKEVCGSYTGRVESDKTIPLELIDTCGIQLNIDSLDCTYIVLNCWQADWGVTKGYMPEFKQLCDKYKDDSTFKCLQRCV